MPVDVLIRPFLKELDFEKALADFLPQHGWEPSVIMNPTEETLIKKWAAIIYNNNRNTDDGNGAHSSYMLTEQQLDSNIKAFVTLYLYVTGMCMNELKQRYDLSLLYLQTV